MLRFPEGRLDFDLGGLDAAYVARLDLRRVDRRARSAEVPVRAPWRPFGHRALFKTTATPATEHP